MSKTTVQRVLSNMQETLPEQVVARDLMMSRFAEYRAHLWPLLADDPVRTVPRLLEVDQLEARTRGLFDQQQAGQWHRQGIGHARHADRSHLGRHGMTRVAKLREQWAANLARLEYAYARPWRQTRRSRPGSHSWRA